MRKSQVTTHGKVVRPRAGSINFVRHFALQQRVGMIPSRALARRLAFDWEVLSSLFGVNKTSLRLQVMKFPPQVE